MDAIDDHEDNVREEAYQDGACLILRARLISLMARHAV